MIGRSRNETNEARRSQQRARRSWNEGLFYELQLNGPTPDRLTISVEDPYKADTEEASQIKDYFDEVCRQGLVRIDGCSPLATPWESISENDIQYKRWQGFRWLSGLRALGEEGKPAARALTDGWLSLNNRFDNETWQTSFVCERLWQLARYGSWMLEGGETLWRSRLLTSMARQTRHLAKAVARLSDPLDRLNAAMTLSLMGLILRSHETCEEQGSNLLRRELRLQLRADGGHISRNPSLQLKIALQLQSLLTTYNVCGREVPNYLHHAVGRTTDMVEFFRCGDGRLSVFNGSIEDDPKALSKALSFDSIGRSRIDFASQSGYQRLAGARSFLFVDMGEAQIGQMIKVDRYRTQRRFDGTFAVQFSSGRQRIFVNCGSPLSLAGARSQLTTDEYDAWEEALASRNAHSTLCVNAPETTEHNGLSVGALEPTYHHLEEDRVGQVLELETATVPGAPGCTHRRRVALNIDGDELLGEDALIPTAATESIPEWCLRFHMHPTIKASISRDARSAILATAHHEGWTFSVEGAVLKLESSIYCGEMGPLQKTRQLVVLPRREQGTIRQVRWSLKK